MKIDKNIPAPTKRVYSEIGIVVAAMEVGDSILVDTRSIASGAGQVARRLGLGTICRKQNSGKYRVWLVKPEMALPYKRNGKHK